MRIIAGEAKGRNLAGRNSNQVRPTLNRVKEAIFNILGPVVPGCRVLDLFAGFGNLGLEAISRGAKEVIFVEKEYKNTAIIKKNLKTCGFENRGIVQQNNVFNYLNTVIQNFDLIFMDPPYSQGLADKALKSICTHDVIFDDSLIILECYQDDVINKPESLIQIKEKEYGDTRVDIYRRKGIG